MKKIGEITKKCDHCGNEHIVQIVEVKGKTTLKKEKVEYIGTYEYCDILDELSAEGDMLIKNNITRKDSYKSKRGLLTSDALRSIRANYLVSQKDLAQILGWGSSTITRYETTQIQDEAHNDILCLVKDDPTWLLTKLESKKEIFVQNNKKTTYTKYYNAIAKEIKLKNKVYFAKILIGNYLYKEEDAIFYGNTDFDLDKVVEMVNYIVEKVEVHKVKLMKLLWYSDALSFKRRGKAISGMAYEAIQMGAVPQDYDMLIHVEGIDYELKYYDDKEAYKFTRNKDVKIEHLTKDELEIIDVIINKLGHMNTNKIVKTMHDEIAFKETAQKALISFAYAEKLKIN